MYYCNYYHYFVNLSVISECVMICVLFSSLYMPEMALVVEQTRAQKSHPQGLLGALSVNK